MSGRKESWLALPSFAVKWTCPVTHSCISSIPPTPGGRSPAVSLTPKPAGGTLDFISPCVMGTLNTTFVRVNVVDFIVRD
jgi:hypothetical protein